MKNLLKINSIKNKFCNKRSVRVGFKQQMFCMIGFILFAQLAVAATHPNMFVNQTEIDAINVKVNAGVEPWASAYDEVILLANIALDQSLESVTFQGDSGNRYYSENPYCGWPSPPAPSNGCIGGDLNPDQDRLDYAAAIRLGNAVRDLGLAYAFTGEAEYAEKAIDFIRVWSLDSGTRMIPTSSPIGGAGRIEIFITMPGYFYGADLIWNYAGWDPAEKAAFVSWVETLGNHTRTNNVGINNFANWRLVLIASVGVLLDDQSLLDFVETEWQRLLPIQMNDSGSAWAGRLGQESGRPRGLHYSLYAINAMIQGAEIMRHQGVNLYDYVHVLESGATVDMKLAIDFITPYAIDPASWIADGYTQTTVITQDDSMALFELAYSYYQNSSYLDVINRWGRPLDEIRVMGINTLTHGNYFDLDFTPTPPSITSQPISQSIEEGLPVTFSFAVSGSGTLEYQWYRNNVLIEGATNASYTIEVVSVDDDGADFHSTVTNNLGGVTSEPARLTVILDTTAPVIAGASVQDLNSVEIQFSEAVSVTSAQAVNNYQISDGIQVVAASLNVDEKTVQLQTDNLVTDTLYTVTINNIQDTSSNANEILPNSNIDIQFAPIMNFDNGLLPFEWTPLTLSRWSVVTDTANNALFLNTTTYNPLSGDRLGEYILTPDSYGDFTLTVEAKVNESTSNDNADYALVFGFEDGSNYYYMLFNRTEDNTELFRVVNGNRVVLGAATSDWLTDDEYHTVAVSVTSSTIEVRFDGNIVLNYTDQTAAIPIGKIGLGSFNDSAYFDDIDITAGTNMISDLIFTDSFE